MEKYRDVTMFVCGLIVGLALMALFAPDVGKGKVPVSSRSSIIEEPRKDFIRIGTLKPTTWGKIDFIHITREKICALLVDAGEEASLSLTGYKTYVRISGSYRDANGNSHMMSAEGQRP